MRSRPPYSLPNDWLLSLLVLLLALACGCARGSSYPNKAMSPAEQSFDDRARTTSLEREEDGRYAYGDADVSEVLADEAEPAPEPADAEPGGAAPSMAPPSPGPVAQAGGSQSAPSAPAGNEPASTSPASAIPPEATSDVPKPQPAAQSDGTDPKLAGPLLIYEATLHMAVYEAQPSIDATQKLALEMGGYLVRRTDRSITVRVPAKAFRKALDGIAELGDVLSREETVKDVTDEFYDLKVRLDNARAMRDRLAKLLEQAENVEEALMVEKELGRVTEQIERFEGRLKLFQELINFSTITVEFRPRPTERVSNVRLPFYWLNQLGLSQLLSL